MKDNKKKVPKSKTVKKMNNNKKSMKIFCALYNYKLCHDDDETNLLFYFLHFFSWKK